LLTAGGFKKTKAGATACLTVAAEERLERVHSMPEVWNRLVDLEWEACKNSGCSDLGDHIIGCGVK
jgi:hypothetical protein